MIMVVGCKDLQNMDVACTFTADVIDAIEEFPGWVFVHS